MTHKPSAGNIVERLLKAAVAGIVDRHAHDDPDSLVIGEIQINGGPIMYRVHQATRGRGFRLRKRFCHITMKLIER
jgi:large subunit ribosomal protein L22